MKQKSCHDSLASCNHCRLRTIGHLFGVAKYAETLQALYLHSIWRQSLGFKDDRNFPQCVQAIDSSHIPIQAPTECPKDDYNRKGYPLILLQGLVDHHYCFMHINVGWPGSVHDAHVLANLELYKNGKGGTYSPNHQRKSRVCLFLS